MFSIISVYKDKKVLENWLLKGLRNQTVNYELILIDNTKGQFKSGAEALNYGASKTKSQSKYIIFVDQDIRLLSNTWLEKAERILDSISNLGIAGVAGARESKNGERETVTNIKHGIPPKNLRNCVFIKKPEKIQTLDECLIIIPRSVFKNLKFNTKTCDSWHFWAVDYCLAVKKLGFDSYVIPLPLHHKSAGIISNNYLKTILSLGPLPGNYFQALKKILKKYKNSYQKIYTTCGEWDTSQPVFFQRLIYFFKTGIRFLLRK